MKDNSITGRLAENFGVNTGQIGIVTLALGMVPMVLMMILAGYHLSDAELDASLTANLNSNVKGFQSQIMLNHLMDTYNDGKYIRGYIRELPYSDSRESDIDHINQTLRDQLEGKVEKYELRIHYPDHSNVVLENGYTSTNDKAWTSVASPSSGGDATVILEIDGWVAQTYIDEPSDDSSGGGGGTTGGDCTTNKCRAYG